jgi:hypothetical protein
MMTWAMVVLVWNYNGTMFDWAWLMLILWPMLPYALGLIAMSLHPNQLGWRNLLFNFIIIAPNTFATYVYWASFMGPNLDAQSGLMVIFFPLWHLLGVGVCSIIAFILLRLHGN